MRAGGGCSDPASGDLGAVCARVSRRSPGGDATTTSSLRSAPGARAFSGASPFAGHGYDCSASYLSKNALHPALRLLHPGIDDTRTCSPCGCGAPSGASCTATISIFPDGECTSAAIDAGSVGTAAPVCVNLDAGEAPAVALAVRLPDEPGACQPTGGDAGGAAVGTGATTFCCIPP